MTYWTRRSRVTNRTLNRHWEKEKKTIIKTSRNSSYENRHSSRIQGTYSVIGITVSKDAVDTRFVVGDGWWWTYIQLCQTITHSHQQPSARPLHSNFQITQICAHDKIGNWIRCSIKYTTSWCKKMSLYWKIIYWHHSKAKLYFPNIKVSCFVSFIPCSYLLLI